MFPSLITQDIQDALQEFIITGYETETPHFQGKFEALVKTRADGQSFIKGPYVSIGLPFHKEPDANRGFFQNFETEHSPFAHQTLAWRRLTGPNAKPTLVATGTGSGKTECFLYPLLDHVMMDRRPGIKAVIIYPMNALATDQAKRFAEVIHDTPEMRTRGITVGLFVGGHEAGGQKVMTREQIITCKESMRKNPPDILLTNYKMLDYLLIRPKDYTLWRYNVVHTDLLRYLVVDELHTFDGAQGSDLAMLIRRLKAFLQIDTQQLIPIGTSATIGSKESEGKLIEFISEIFDAPFDSESIIGETRVSPAEFQRPLEYFSLSYDFDPQWLDPKKFTHEYDYLKHQAWLLFGKADEGGFDLENNLESRVLLGEKLKSHALFLKLLQDTEHATHFSQLLPESKQLPPHLREYSQQIIISLLALTAHARGGDYPNQPFVSLRFQVWIRELRRIVSSVDPDPQKVTLYYSDDLKQNEEFITLPVLQCSECHATAWLSAATNHDHSSGEIEQNLKQLYTAFFSNDANYKILIPLTKDSPLPKAGNGTQKQLCATCGYLSTETKQHCQQCGSDQLVSVFESRSIIQKEHHGIKENHQESACAICGADNSLIIFGSRAASLASIAINQLFANRWNEDKKLIVFSDSVQDAAHRAGFYSARTWKMNIRMALAQYATKHQTNPYLTTLNNWSYDLVKDKNWSDEKFICEFIAPTMMSNVTYLRLTQGEKVDPESLKWLVEDIHKRLAWEAFQEVGITSQIGRSLERTGTAAISWDPILIKEAVPLLKSQCYNHLGYELDDTSAEIILWGITLHMKQRGAIFYALLDKFVETGGDFYYLNRISYLPNFGIHSPLPRFPAEDRCRMLDPVLSSSKKSWYLQWLILHSNVGLLSDQNFYKNFFYYVMDCLTKTGLILERYTNKNIRVWGLNPNKITITSNLVRMKSGHEYFYLPRIWLDSLNGFPSLKLSQYQSETEHYHSHWELADNEENFYRTFFLEGDIERVIGHEHTGLLSREDRERVEIQFKATGEQRQPWYENLLSATPTLEMGIDIGDLSSVILASVPPTQASYLQRIGRAGRSTGNSVTLTVANGHPHDLYFFASPEEMMRGDVDPPAIFLQATMVLKRQLLAYCFDSWNRHNKGEHLIPLTMQPVINTVKEGVGARFPFTLINFIQKNRPALWQGFSQLLPYDINHKAKQFLKQLFINEDEQENQIEWILINRIKELQQELARLDEQKKRLEIELKRVEKYPEDDIKTNTLAELQKERDGIFRLRQSILQKETLNFLTDEGLLPNYAFPEEGTTLKSVIYWAKNSGKKSNATEPSNSKSNFDSKTYEYTRPAHSAISELAPMNSFYASTYKVKISRIETAKGKAIDRIRICPNCSYNEKNSGNNIQPTCPRCGDAGWRDKGQEFNVLRLTQVYANTSLSEAILNDEKDSREPLFYNKQMLVDLYDSPHEDDIAYTFEDDSKPFGFQFVRKARFLEINFGESTGRFDMIIKVAGQELERPGFKICSECGTVQVAQKNKKGPQHQLYCKYHPNSQYSRKSNLLEKTKDGIIDCLYLYREYESEAISIKMPHFPLLTLKEQMDSFVAATQLGLKKRFGGKVDHLQILVTDEPIPNSDLREYYLVIYDTVPGGTGYLHDLMANPNNLLEIYETAQTVMAQCSCQKAEPILDGCYRCLYAYRNSYGMETTSRKVALNMIHQILDGDVKLKVIDHLKNIPSTIWADSPLEEQFPEALKRACGKALNDRELPAQQQVITFTLDLIEGKKAYHIQFAGHKYFMKMHVNLTHAGGIPYACEPDFVLYPVDNPHMRPIAIFLDGFKYHYNIVHEDLLKRMGLILSGQYWVISLSWHDINPAFASNEYLTLSPFREHRHDITPIITQIKAYLPDCVTILNYSSLELLIYLMLQGNNDDFKTISTIQALSMLFPPEQKTLTQNQQLWQEVTQNFPEAYQHHTMEIEPEFIRQLIWNDAGNELMLLIACNKEFIRKSLNIKKSNNEEITQEEHAIDHMKVGLQITTTDMPNESTRLIWGKLWQCFNWLQFTANFYAGDRIRTDNGEYSQLSWNPRNAIPIDTEWENILQEAISEIHPFIHLLAHENGSKPEVGYEITNTKGSVIAEAELAWTEAEIYIVLEQEDFDILTMDPKRQVFLYDDEYIEDIFDQIKDKI